MTVAAVVLAAGGSSRWSGQGGHKLLADLAGRPIWRWCTDAAVAAQVDQVFLVVGAVELAPAPEGVTVLRNERWSSGQAGSLRTGVLAAEAAGHDAVVVGLADSPLVPSAAWRAVAGSTTTPLAIADFGGRRRPPVRIAQECWPDLPSEGDRGAGLLLRRSPHLVTPVPCPGVPDDVDTLEDLARLRALVTQLGAR